MVKYRSPKGHFNTEMEKKEYVMSPKTINVDIEKLKGGWLEASSPDVVGLYIYSGSSEEALIENLPALINCFKKREMAKNKKRSSKKYRPTHMELSRVAYTCTA